MDDNADAGTVGVDQDTLTPDERAERDALVAVVAAYRSEVATRERLTAAKAHTAAVINGARHARCTWADIAEWMGGMNVRSVSARWAKRDPSAPVPTLQDWPVTLNDALDAEKDAAGEISQATDAVAAAIAVARQAGASWTRIGQAAGDRSRRTLTVRLRNWAGSSTLAVPDQAHPGGSVPSLSGADLGLAGTAAELWANPWVRRGVTEGAVIAGGRVRAQALAEGQEPAAVLAAVADVQERAVRAAAAVVAQEASRAGGHAADMAEVAKGALVAAAGAL